MTWFGRLLEMLHSELSDRFSVSHLLCAFSNVRKAFKSLLEDAFKELSQCLVHECFEQSFDVQFHSTFSSSHNNRHTTWYFPTFSLCLLFPHSNHATKSCSIAVGSVVNLLIHPVGALLIGSAAGALSVIGYHFLSVSFQPIFNFCTIFLVLSRPSQSVAINFPRFFIPHVWLPDRSRLLDLFMVLAENAGEKSHRR